MSVEYSWAMNELKLHRARVKANEAAKLHADINKTPFKAPTEDDIKALYVSYGGLVAETKEDLQSAKEAAKESAQKALEERITKLENARRRALRQETMKDGEEDQVSMMQSELKELREALKALKKAKD